MYLPRFIAVFSRRKQPNVIPSSSLITHKTVTSFIIKIWNNFEVCYVLPLFTRIPWKIFYVKKTNSMRDATYFIENYTYAPGVNGGIDFLDSKILCSWQSYGLENILYWEIKLGSIKSLLPLVIVSLQRSTKWLNANATGRRWEK